VSSREARPPAAPVRVAVSHFVRDRRVVSPRRYGLRVSAGGRSLPLSGPLGRRSVHRTLPDSAAQTRKLIDSDRPPLSDSTSIRPLATEGAKLATAYFVIFHRNFISVNPIALSVHCKSHERIIGGGDILQQRIFSLMALSRLECIRK